METESTKRSQNRLASEKSPYLLQHASNPVNWYPWGEEAFAKARAEKKPVFLSIGYSTCHWCHVMAHESFEDEEVARLMNDTFVSIKVDREERPDIDGVYMTACQLMTGSGGWPLSIVMTPEKKPFFAATYIPRESRFGRIGMLDLVPRIKEIWAQRQAEVRESAEEIAAALGRCSQGTAGAELGAPVLTLAFEQLAARFDIEHGGFGDAPKFPTPHHLLFLLRYWKRTREGAALQMVEKTLERMRRGGIWDHVGFGFHRYSTDRQWLVPHFEKMLYDQALTAMAYIEAYQATGKAEYEKTAREIFTYILLDMTAAEGGFFSAEDADSEGEEGKFYLWTEDEIRAALNGEEGNLAIAIFNVSRDGNYRQEAGGLRTGRNILHLRESMGELARRLGISEPQLQQRLGKIRERLFEHRTQRPHPHRDDKILTDWNGLMIAALAKAAQAFDEGEYAAVARRAADFLLTHMRTPDGRLLHRYREGQAAIQGSADDYAFLIWGLIELYEATFEARYLEAALELNKQFIAHFWDDASGGFWATPDDGEEILFRRKEIYDGAVPSANSVAMLNLLRIARLTGDATMEERADHTARAFSGEVSQSPAAYTFLMCGASFALGPAHEVIIAGNPVSEDTRAMLRALRRGFHPNTVALLRPIEKGSSEIDRLAGFAAGYGALDGRATAYVCTNYQCHSPTTDPTEMIALVEADQ